MLQAKFKNIMISNPAFLYDENDNLSKLIGCIRNSNHSSFVELLNGMKLHFINNVIYDGHTIMQHAVTHGLDDFVNTLLSLNVDANIGEGLNKPVLLAASYGHWKILKTFMDLRWHDEIMSQKPKMLEGKFYMTPMLIQRKKS